MQDEISLRVVRPGTGETDAAVTGMIAQALGQAGVAVRRPDTAAAPGMKGDGVVAALLVPLAEPIIRKLLDIVAGLFSRPAAPPVQIELEVVGGGKLKMSFDPRTLTPDQAQSLVKEIVGSVGGAPRAG